MKAITNLSMLNHKEDNSPTVGDVSSEVECIKKQLRCLFQVEDVHSLTSAK